ncbi:MAG TPA: hypothetical protein PLV61_16220, partial [Parvularculaceae bacterium]|nr:hypothetical protein [Parvularculaceae bacterium]
DLSFNTKCSDAAAACLFSEYVHPLYTFSTKNGSMCRGNGTLAKACKAVENSTSEIPGGVLILSHNYP